MEIKTKSGVSITFIPEGSSKIVLFDRPVRALELKKGEILQISALLASRPETKTNVKLQSRHSHPNKVTKAVSR